MAMTPHELAAFRAGILHAASQAQIAAVSIEIREDAGHIRQQAAAAALRGLAKGLKEAAGRPPQLEETSSDTGVCGTLSSHCMAGRAAAIAAGYLGDICDACGSSEIKRSGPA